MRHLTLCLMLAVVGSSHAAGAVDTVGTPDEKLPKRVLFQHLANDVLLPLTSDFATTAGKLATASSGFCATPRTATLAEVRAAWRSAQSAWQPLEMLQLGPTIERRTQRQVNAWPVRPSLLEPLLTGEKPIDSAQAEALGAAGKGFPALEYLLFVPDKSAADTEKALTGTRCTVLQALAAQMKAEADGLAADWRKPNGGFARKLAEAGRHAQGGAFASADQALSDIANLLIAGLDAVKVRKLGKPLEKSGDDAALERIEAWRSEMSLDHIRDNLRGFELVFFGAGKDGIGMDNYLVGIGRPVLVRLVREDLTAAQVALRAIRPPLQRALVTQRKQVDALHKAVARLQRRMEDDIADALKVDLGFNANDGD